MIQRICLFAIFVFGIQYMYGQNIWIKRDSVNGPPRGACASFTLNGEGFVATGVNVEEFKRKMYSYDLEQDDWDNESGVGGPTGGGLERASAIGFSTGGYGFIGLGTGTSSLKKDLWRYDPETESWTQMADFAGEARSGAVAFDLDGYGYVGTGQSESGLHNDFYRYSVSSNTWEELNDFEGLPRKEAVAFIMGGKGYLGTGRSESGYLKDFWEYDPVTDEWSQKADFPGTPRMGATGCGVFPSAYIMLGEDNSFTYQDDVWEWNYFGNVWTQRADYMGGPRTQASAFAVDGRIFVGLGYDGVYHDDFYEYERLLATDESEQFLNLNLYPNPTLNEVTVLTDQPIERVQFFNMSGTELTAHLTITGFNSNTLEILGLSNFSAGNYLILLTDSQNNQTSRTIVVQ